MGLSEEFAVLRKRIADLELAIDRANKNRPDGQASMTGRVFNNGAMPSTVPAFFAVHPVDLGGAEVEGGSITFTESTGVVYFLVIGPDVPEVGDVLFADSCNGRWVAEHQVGETVTPPVDLGCGCPTVPATIYLKATAPSLNNQIFQDATLVYGPAPAPFVGHAGIPADSHWSPGTFTDGSGFTFYYVFYCLSSVYRLDLAYTTGPSSPVINNRYTWNALSTAGNTCNVFYMLNGTIFAGGNATNKNYVSGIAGDWAIGEKLLSGNCRTSGFVSISGATVTCDGVSGVSNVNGDFAFKIPQSASSRGWTATKSGFSPSSGTVAGQAVDAAVPQFTAINVVMSP